MDSDGEDSPYDLKILLENTKSLNAITFANRTNRLENIFFKLSYFLISCPCYQNELDHFDLLIFF